MTVVFYDVENIKEEKSHNKCFEIINKITKDEKFLSFAYTDWTRVDNNIRNIFIDNGANLKQVVSGSSYSSSIKNASDIALSIDATEILLKNKKVKKLILVSGDGGYISLVNKYQEYGKEVHIISIEEHFNKSLEKYVDECHLFKKEDEFSQKNSFIRTQTIQSSSFGTVLLPKNNKIEKQHESMEIHTRKKVFEKYQNAIWGILKSYAEESSIYKAIEVIFSNYSVKEKINTDGMKVTEIVNIANKIQIRNYNNEEFKNRLVAYAPKEFHCSIKGKDGWSTFFSKKRPDGYYKTKEALAEQGFDVRGLPLYRNLSEIFQLRLQNSVLSLLRMEPVVERNITRLLSIIKNDMPHQKYESINASNFEDLTSGVIAKFLNDPKRPISKKDVLEFFEYYKEKLQQRVYRNNGGK